MDYQSLHMKTVVDLKRLAKEMGVRVPAGTNKNVLIEMLLEAERNAEAQKPAAKPAPTDAPVSATSAESPNPPAPKRRGRPPKNRAAQGDVKADAKPDPETASTKPAAQPAGKKEMAKPADGGEAAKPPVQPAASVEIEARPVAAGKPESADMQAAPKPEPARPEAQKAPKSESTAAEVKTAVKPESTAAATQAAPNAEAGKPETQAVSKVEPTAVEAQSAPKAEAGKFEAQSVPRFQRVETEGRPFQRGFASRGMVRSAGSDPSARTPDNQPRPAQPTQRMPDNQPRPVQPMQRTPDNQPRFSQSGQRRPDGQPHAAQRPTEGYMARQAGQRFTPRPGVVRDAAQPAHIQQTEAAAEAPRQAEYVESGSARGRREGYYNAEYKTSNPAVPEMLTSGECADGAGVLEIQPDGYGFLRAENCLPGPNDVYISIAQIRRFCLRMGDYVEGKTRPQREGDRYSAMLYITSVNGEPPENAAARPRFEDLVPIYPDERLRLETPAMSGRGDYSLRLIDMLAPIGKGQRGMIVSQPKAGKTTLLKKVANAITTNYPDIRLIVLLIDERPEEVTDMKRSINGEVIYSTFDEAPENHVRVSEMVLERAQRMVEMGQDVVVLMDSITRLARAYNLVITPTGRSLSGGLDPGALFKPKRFFGAARNIENGGSLTVIATALVETGSRMDDIIFEEFKGTGNMELHLDRKLSDKRVFPAIDMVRSGTRREELLLTEAELDGEMLVRRVLSGGRGQEMAEQIIQLMSKTATNAEFFEKLKGWIGVFEKEGYTLGGK